MLPSAVAATATRPFNAKAHAVTSQGAAKTEEKSGESAVGIHIGAVVLQHCPKETTSCVQTAHISRISVARSSRVSKKQRYKLRSVTGNQYQTNRALVVVQLTEKVLGSLWQAQLPHSQAVPRVRYIPPGGIAKIRCAA